MAKDNSKKKIASPIGADRLSDFDITYFDTSVLCEANWPVLSAALQEVLSLAKRLNKTIVIPDLVLKELKRQSIEQYDKANGVCKDNLEKLKTIAKKVGVEVTSHLSEASQQFEHRYDETVTNLLRSWGIETCPLPTVELSELVDAAVHRELAFEDGGKGFQDTVIFLSVVQHLQRKARTGILVSNDHIFEKRREALRGRLPALCIANSLGSVSRHLGNILTSLDQAHLDRLRRTAVQNLSSQLADVQTWLSDHVEEFHWRLGHRLGIGLFQVTDVQVDRVISATVPLEDRKDVPLSFVAEARFAGRPIYSVSSSAWAILAGAGRPSGFKHSFPEHLGPTTSDLGTYWVEIDAMATWDGQKYSDFRFLRAVWRNPPPPPPPS